MKFLSFALAATLTRFASASLQIVPGATWTTVRLPSLFALQHVADSL